MISITKAEGRVLLRLFGDFNTNYNANSLSGVVGLSSRGTLNILKSLESKRILTSKKFGKAVFYRINFSETYNIKILETLLIGEAREKAGRWEEEFKEVYGVADIVIIFGSILKNSEKANDVDVLFVYEKNKYKKLRDFVNSKNKILYKKIHDISQTKSDLIHNLKNKNPALINVIKEGYVLHGQDKFIEVIKNVTSS